MTTVLLPRRGIYLCSRSSSYSAKPCDEAFRVYVRRVDVRTTDDPRKIPANKGTDGDWYTKGSNHRVEGGRIMRDVDPTEDWAVEVPDLEAFVRKYGNCVLGFDSAGYATLEIYDDYRE